MSLAAVLACRAEYCARPYMGEDAGIPQLFRFCWTTEVFLLLVIPIKAWKDQDPWTPNTQAVRCAPGSEEACYERARTANRILFYEFVLSVALGGDCGHGIQQQAVVTCTSNFAQRWVPGFKTLGCCAADSRRLEDRRCSCYERVQF